MRIHSEAYDTIYAYKYSLHYTHNVCSPKKELYACVDTRFSKQMSHDDDVGVTHLLR